MILELVILEIIPKSFLKNWKSEEETIQSTAFLKQPKCDKVLRSFSVIWSPAKVTSFHLCENSWNNGKRNNKYIGSESHVSFYRIKLLILFCHLFQLSVSTISILPVIHRTSKVKKRKRKWKWSEIDFASGSTHQAPILLNNHTRRGLDSILYPFYFKSRSVLYGIDTKRSEESILRFWFEDQ